MDSITLKSEPLTFEEHREPHGLHQTLPPSSLEAELTALLNRYSQENESNTPDFIMAEYLLGCLAAYNRTVQRRNTWFNHPSL